MKLLIDETFPKSVLVGASAAVELERWQEGSADDEAFLRAASEGGFAGAVFLGEETLALDYITRLAEDLGISVIAIGNDDPGAAAEYLLRNLKKISVLVEVPAALLVWSDRVVRRPLAAARRYEDDVVRALRSLGAEVESEVFRTRFDALVKFGKSRLGLATSVSDRRSFQSLVHQVRYWLGSQSDLDGALVIVNAPPRSSSIDGLRNQLEKRLQELPQRFEVVTWRPNDSIEELRGALRTLAGSSASL